jgi:hypothetical protein
MLLSDLCYARKARGLWPFVAVTVIVAGAFWLLYFVYRSRQRSDLEAFVALAISVGTVAAGWIAWTWRAGLSRSGDAVGVGEVVQLADLLAGAVKDQWTRAASDRGLLEPTPIPVRWHKPSMPVAGPVSVAVSSKRFPPLPGLAAVGQQRLQAGHIRDLHAVYGGLGSGRLVIAGAPGSGKSGAAVLLVLAALKHREQASANDRPLVPVPVMFTLREWDPNTQRVQDWIAGQLRQTYPLFTGKRGAEKAAALLAEGKVAVILDGLDEIPEELRPQALRAISQQATCRLIILTRSDEMAEAASRGLLEGAAALELQDIDPVTAAGYLARIQLDPAPPAWRELTSRLRRAPASPISQALNSPLALTLVRDTYRSGDNVRELLDFCDSGGPHASRDDILDHLLDRVLPAAYAQRPGDPPLRYNLHTAQQALRCLAARLNQDGTRDLLWWRIPEWAPAVPRIIATGLVFGLTAGLTGGLPFGFPFGLAAALTGGFAFGLMAGLGEPPLRMAPLRWREVVRSLWRASRTMQYVGFTGGLAVGLAVGFTSGLAAGLAVGLTSGLAFALGIGLANGLLGVFFQPDADNASSLSPLMSWRGNRASALAIGPTFGLAAGLAFGLTLGLAGWFAAALAAGLTFAIIIGPSVGQKIGVGRMIGRALTLALGLADGLIFGHSGRAAGGLTAGLALGLVAGLALGLAFGLMYTATWSTSLTFAQLAVRWGTPVRLMRFLEDARARGVLRTVGPIYQFRHARLQDRLAEQAFAANQATVAASPPKP